MPKTLICDLLIAPATITTGLHARASTGRIIGCGTMVALVQPIGPITSRSRGMGKFASRSWYW